ncbi:hypothetical protein RZS08_48035, partial [Arthrospira platensis SPKY1]|nr:hypothetical protein [Arthrospira platensis SPKY1]
WRFATETKHRMLMISLLDLAGCLAAAVALILLLVYRHRHLAASEAWIIGIVCTMTVFINAMGFSAWAGQTIASDIAEN